MGTGLKVLNNSIDGLTLAAIAFDNIENDGDLANNSGSYTQKNVDEVTGNGITDAYGNKIEQNNLYGAAAIYSSEWFSAQTWYAHLQNVTSLWALDLAAKYDFSDDFSLRARLNVGGGHFTNQIRGYYNKAVTAALGADRTKNESPLANTYMLGVNLGLTYEWFSADAGFITYGKKGKIGALSLESNAKYISSGEYVLDYTHFTGKHTAWFGKIGVKYDAYSLGLDYTYDYAKGAERYINGSDVKTDAFTIRAGYKYSDKLNFAAWWEIQNAKATYDDGRASIKDKYSRFRFDARYDF